PVTSFSNEKLATQRPNNPVGRNPMKRVLVVVALIICAAALGLWRSHGSVRAGFSRVVNAAGDNNSPGATGDETRKTFDLKPGAHVQIEGINGRVEIQTSDTKTA